jgi:hypothetical protein
MSYICTYIDIDYGEFPPPETMNIVFFSFASSFAVYYYYYYSPRGALTLPETTRDRLRPIIIARRFKVLELS